MQYKNITILFSLSLLFGNISITAMMKRKFKEEKEKEVEYIPEEKKLKKTEEIEIDPTKKQPKRLLEHAAQQLINSFLAEENIQKIAELRNQYNNLFPEMKEYITQLINQPNVAGETLLHQARTPQEVDKLLFLGANPMIRNKVLQIPLATMIAYGNVQAAEALIDKQSASKGYRSDTIYYALLEDSYYQLSGFTPFHFAIAFNAFPLAEKLLKHVYRDKINIGHSVINIDHPAINIVGPDIEYNTLPLLALAAQYSIEAIPLLLQLGININASAENNELPIMFLVKNPNARPADIDFMVKSGADIHAKDDYNSNLIVYAVKGNNNAIIQHLVEEYKLDLNERNGDVDKHDESFKNGRLPIDYAVAGLDNPTTTIEKQIETISTLLNLGSELPSNGREILNPGHFVYIDSDESLRTDLLELLLKHGASINASNNRGYTLANVIFDDYDFSKIINTIRRQDKFFPYDLIKFLIENGARIMQSDKDIIMQSQYEKLKKLISKAAVVDDVVKNGDL